MSLQAISVGTFDARFARAKYCKVLLFETKLNYVSPQAISGQRNSQKLSFGENKDTYLRKVRSSNELVEKKLWPCKGSKKYK